MNSKKGLNDMQTRSMASIGLILSALVVVPFAEAAEREDHAFRFNYSCQIIDVPKGAVNVDLWIPVPSDCQGQQVQSVEILRPAGASIAVEEKYGNHIFHKRFSAPREDLNELGAALAFDVVRQEVVIPEAKDLTSSKRVEPPAELDVYLQPTRLIPIDGRIALMAIDLKIGAKEPIRAGRFLYDYLIETMTYNWKAEGAGQGDVRWACDSKTGDCSDYHSMFIALCRASGIPADHEFGFPIRTEEPQGRIPSYHCWARFWVDGIGWIPLDISEADKHAELLSYNFGSLSARLLKLSHGRDVTLVPPQKAEPLNTFIHPYVEIDGIPHDDIEWKMTFEELSP